MQTLKPRVQVLNVRTARAQTQTVRITGSRLQTIRENYFRIKPLCVECEKQGRPALATELDHITPLWMGGKDNDANRQGLCHDCHAAKTAEEAKHRAAGTTP